MKKFDKTNSDNSIRKLNIEQIFEKKQIVNMIISLYMKNLKIHKNDVKVKTVLISKF